MVAAGLNLMDPLEARWRAKDSRGWKGLSEVLEKNCYCLRCGM